MSQVAPLKKIEKKEKERKGAEHLPLSHRLRGGKVKLRGGGKLGRDFT